MTLSFGMNFVLLIILVINNHLICIYIIDCLISHYGILMPWLMMIIVLIFFVNLSLALRNLLSFPCSDLSLWLNLWSLKNLIEVFHGVEILDLIDMETRKDNFVVISNITTWLEILIYF